jgi:hypothetical protein
MIVGPKLVDGNVDDAILLGSSLCFLPIYFVPTFIGRKKKNAAAIFMLNLLAGWTFIGWCVAMVWSRMKD